MLGRLALVGSLIALICAGVRAQGYHRRADCVYSPTGYESRCGYVTLPQDYARADAGAVEIFYSVIESRGDDPAADPLVYLVGGPGSSGSQLASVSFRAYLRHFAHERDIVVIDQRGTGLSNPPLYCREALFRLDEILQSHHAAHAELMLEILSDCRSRLAEKGVSFETFHSENIARDVAHVLLALGYEQWNLVGVSYGSRLALVMMRDYPQFLRSVILDSVYPPQADIYLDAYYHGERALSVLFAACDASTDCAQRYPDLEVVFYRLYERLNRQPALVTIKPPEFQELKIEISGYRLYDWVFGWLYEVDSIELMPRLIYELARGQPRNAAMVGATFEAAMTRLSLGMHYTVQCQEEYGSAADRDYAPMLAELPHLAGYLRYPVEGSATLGKLCDLFGVVARAPKSNEAVESGIPALLLSGEYDPITPPIYADQAEAGLSAAFNFVLPHVGHGALRSHICAVRISPWLS